jgi:ribosome biogenesis GTPase A
VESEGEEERKQESQSADRELQDQPHGQAKKSRTTLPISSPRRNEEHFYSPFVFLQINDALKWNVHPDAAQILQEIGPRPLKIVCIAGPMRRGKSYLMNRLANKQSGFDVGSTVRGCTRGIWGWFIRGDSDYLVESGMVAGDTTHDILLLDTEGMYDPDRRDTLIDSRGYPSLVDVGLQHHDRD